MREAEWRKMPAKVFMDDWEENMDVRVAACGSPEHMKNKIKAKNAVITIEKNKLKKFIDGLERTKHE